MPPMRLCVVALSCAAVLSSADPGRALVIYRLGGADPPPPEADRSGVRFEQHPWDEVDESAGGQALEVEVGPGRIAALERDPTHNIAPGVGQQGGLYVQKQVNGVVWDGDEGTSWEAEPYLCARFEAYSLFCTDDFGTLGTANIILGSMYRIDRIRVVSGLGDPSRIAQNLRVFLSPEPPETPWHPGWHPKPFSPWLLEVRDNREPVLDIPIPGDRQVGFVQVGLGEHVDPWEVHEIQIFSRGFVERSTYISNVLDLGGPLALGELRWSGSKGEKAQVQIQTRTGTDDDPRRYWRYTGRGGERAEVSRAEYETLRVGERGGTGSDPAHWSLWSTYEFGDSLGAQLQSPSPRRYLQVRVDFLPVDPDGGHIDAVELRASPPVATALVGEVWPDRVRTGELTRFTYALRPTIRTTDPGFDRVELQSRALLGAVQAVRVGDEAVPYAVEVADAHRLVVSLPRLSSGDSGALVELEFEARVLRYGTPLEARVWDSQSLEEVPQGVVAGDASGQFESNRVTVATAAGRQSTLQVRPLPAVATPNGDGVNEEAGVEYEVLEVTGQAAVEVVVFDLAGRPLRTVESAARGAGRYRSSWNGRDEGGRLAAPGVYLCRVSVQTDEGREERTLLLHLAY